MSDNVIRFPSGPRLNADFNFFLSSPGRRYHVRDATEDDLSIPGVEEQHPQQGDILVMERVSDPDSDCGFSVHNWVFCCRHEVLNTDEDISRLLWKMRRPGSNEAVFAADFIKGHVCVYLSRREIELLATAIEADAMQHAQSHGIYPRDLFDARERAAELRRNVGGSV